MPLQELKKQEQFEALWFLKPEDPLLEGMRPTDGGWIQYHTAKWCGPCQRLRLADILAEAEKRGLTVWKIDVDVNEYTSGYCGVRSVPTFQFCVPKKIVSDNTTGNTDAILAWIRGL